MLNRTRYFMNSAAFLALEIGRRQKPVFWRTGVLLWFLPAWLLAQGAAEPLENIREAAVQHVLERIQNDHYISLEASAGELDARLNLPKCGAPLETFSNTAPAPGRATVGVRCTGSRPWTLYVPVSIDAMVLAIAVNKALARGTVLREADLEETVLSTARLPAGAPGNKKELVGMELSRTVRAGAVVTLNMVKPALVIKRGQKVIILARTGGLEVRMSGVALENGAAGDRVNIRNSGSGRTVEAVIIGAGTVQVRM